MRKTSILIALLALAGCGRQYSEISNTQCTDWREVSGFRRDYFNGGYMSVDEVLCVVKEVKAQKPN